MGKLKSLYRLKKIDPNLKRKKKKKNVENENTYLSI